MGACWSLWGDEGTDIDTRQSGGGVSSNGVVEDADTATGDGDSLCVAHDAITSAGCVDSDVTCSWDICVRNLNC